MVWQEFKRLPIGWSHVPKVRSALGDDAFRDATNKKLSVVSQVQGGVCQIS